MQHLKSLLSDSTDWRLLVDYTDRIIVFPPEIVATSERPDIVNWSVALKVIMIELTCPAEEGIEAARERKLGRCSQLKAGYWRCGLGGWPFHNRGRRPWTCRLLY